MLPIASDAQKPLSPSAIRSASIASLYASWKSASGACPLLIPALTGYINRAKEKNVIAETRQCVMAAQTLYDEAYANTDKNGTVTPPSNSDIKKLAEVKGNVLETESNKITFDNGRITHLEYSNNGITCTYNGSTYNVPQK